MFGAGTACVVCPVKEIVFLDEVSINRNDHTIILISEFFQL